MVGADDLSGLSEAQLVQAYVENVQALAGIEHVGAYNRQFARCLKIVDELKARTSTLQPLRGLLDHPNAEVRRWAQSDLDQLDHPREAPPPRQSLRWELQWQCDNPPPSAMSRAEIAQRLRDVLPEFADQLIDLAQPAIGLWPQRPRAGRPPTARSSARFPPAKTTSASRVGAGLSRAPSAANASPSDRSQLMANIASASAPIRSQ